MSTIEESALNTYTKNIEYFKNNHPVIYEKIDNLNTHLNSILYTHKYELEYKDEGYFDVLELESNQFLYKKNSLKYSEFLVDIINFKKSDQVCETFFNFVYTKSALEKAIESDATTRHATLAPIYDFYSNTISKDMSFKYIKKFIFFGLGLGLHVEKIIQKINPTVVLFLETDLELFRLSFFTCDYEKAIGGRLAIFSIDEDTNEYKNSFTTFYNNGAFENQYLKYSLFSSIYESKINEIQTFLVTRSENCYPHERILFKNHQVLKRMKEGYKFLDLKKKRGETYFKDRPILILAAGPSLEKNIQWIKKHQDEFVILCVFATLKTLLKHDIEPNIVIQLEEKINHTVDLVHSFDNFDFLNNSIFIFSASSPNILLNTFKKENIFLIEDRTTYLQDILRINAASVGEVAYSIALIFNSYNTYLLGLDLALAEDGATHSKEHHGATKLDLSKTNGVKKIVTLQESTLKIKGNFKDVVSTTPLLAMSIPLLDEYTINLKYEHQNIYNMCDGAFFQNIIPLKINDVKQLTPLNKSNLTVELIELFDKFSKTSTNNDELRDSLLTRQKQLNEFYQYVEDFKQTNTKTAQRFMKAFKLCFGNISSSKKSELKELMSVYILNTSKYVSDLFNTVELKDEKNITKEMKKIYITQVIKILDYYRDVLEKNISQ
jgi:hypothetical protein